VSAFKKIGMVHDRLMGRMLGSLIRPGMTWEEVGQILAPFRPLVIDRIQSYAFCGWISIWVSYSRHGLIIDYSLDEQRFPDGPVVHSDVWRVVSVSFHPLLGGDEHCQGTR
jgi:hypothetical protein